MKDNLIHPKDKPANELIIIADECGDSLWDAVLRQEVKAYDMKEISTNAFFVRTNINAAQECDATVAQMIFNSLVQK